MLGKIFIDRKAFSFSVFFFIVFLFRKWKIRPKIAMFSSTRAFSEALFLDISCSEPHNSTRTKTPYGGWARKKYFGNKSQTCHKIWQHFVVKSVVFKWTRLHIIDSCSRRNKRASHKQVLGCPTMLSPTWHRRKTRLRSVWKQKQSFLVLFWGLPSWLFGQSTSPVLNPELRTSVRRMTHGLTLTLEIRDPFDLDVHCSWFSRLSFRSSFDLAFSFHYLIWLLLFLSFRWHGDQGSHDGPVARAADVRRQLISRRAARASDVFRDVIINCGPDAAAPPVFIQ